MKMKKIIAGILFSIMVIGYTLVASAATTHEHNYAGNYSYEEVYSESVTCNQHEDCKIRTQYLNVFDTCTSCGFRTYIRTETKVMHVITILDSPFR